MLVVLYSDDWRDAAESIASDLAAAYSDRLEIELVPAAAPNEWKAEQSWDDLLLVLFDGKLMPAGGEKFIEAHQSLHESTRMVLPIAMDREHQKPPQAIAGIKALDYDETAKGPTGRLAKRVGAMLGLCVQSRENQIFISYRKADGAAIAVQLHRHLETLGYRPWLDEAREFDGNPTILPGTLVQQQIDDALSKANILLLVDTPSAPNSVWIQHEVATANSLLLPILPLSFRNRDDLRKGPRFRSLADLQRWVPLANPAPSQDAPLSAEDLKRIIAEMETYLCDIFRRKCRVPFLVEKEFVSRRFAWRVLDQRFLMFECTKQDSWRLPLKVLSHCSIFEQVCASGLTKLAEFLAKTDRANHALYIYDGELLPEPELKAIVQKQSWPAIILHHQELATLLDSNFRSLPA